MDKLIEALKVIKEECEKNDFSCESCPLECGGDCGLVMSEPRNWKIEVKKKLIL